MSENDQPHLPPPSLWPIGFAVGVACVLTGIVVSSIVAVVGAVIALAFGFLWLRDVTRPVRTPGAGRRARAARDVQGDRAADDEPEAYPRSTFLSISTLGLGAVIGGLITVPVLGFAVLPSFTNQDEQDVVLGPIDEFPEGEFVIATYMENPEVGEVTRRTMLITERGRPPADLVDRGDDAVRRVAVGQARGQQQPSVRAGLGRVDDRAAVAVQLHRHDHAGQHHEIGQGQQRQGDDISHGELLGFLSL